MVFFNWCLLLWLCLLCVVLFLFVSGLFCQFGKMRHFLGLGYVAVVRGTGVPLYSGTFPCPPPLPPKTKLVKSRSEKTDNFALPIEWVARRRNVPLCTCPFFQTHQRLSSCVYRLSMVFVSALFGVCFGCRWCFSWLSMVSAPGANRFACAETIFAQTLLQKIPST